MGKLANLLCVQLLAKNLTDGIFFVSVQTEEFEQAACGIGARDQIFEAENVNPVLADFLPERLDVTVGFGPEP